MTAELGPITTDADARANRQAAGLMVLFTRFGAIISDALADHAGDREFVGNIPLLLLFELDTRGPCRPTDIQSLTGLSSGGVTKLIDRLENRGYVARRDGHPAGDRRGVVVALTEDGSRLVDDLAACLAARFDDIRAFARDLTILLDSPADTTRSVR